MAEYAPRSGLIRRWSNLLAEQFTVTGNDFKHMSSTNGSSGEGWAGGSFNKSQQQTDMPQHYRRQAYSLSKKREVVQQTELEKGFVRYIHQAGNQGCSCNKVGLKKQGRRQFEWEKTDVKGEAHSKQQSITSQPVTQVIRQVVHHYHVQTPIVQQTQTVVHPPTVTHTPTIPRAVSATHLTRRVAPPAIPTKLTFQYQSPHTHTAPLVLTSSQASEWKQPSSRPNSPSKPKQGIEVTAKQEAERQGTGHFIEESEQVDAKEKTHKVVSSSLMIFENSEGVQSGGMFSPSLKDIPSASP